MIASAASRATASSVRRKASIPSIRTSRISSEKITSGSQSVDPKVARSPKFIDEVTSAFVALKPFMAFITAAVGLSFQLDD